jgi:hypothetical protein
VPVAVNFANAATNAGNAETAIKNAKIHSNEIAANWAKITGSAYTAETSSLGAEAALTRGAREMSDADFSQGFKNVRQELRDLGGEYENLANTGAGLKPIATALGLDTEVKNPKRLLLEVEDELKKIADTPVDINIKFNEELFKASITSLYDQANSGFASPIPLSLDAQESIGEQRISAENGFVEPIALNLDGQQSVEDIATSAKDNFSNPIFWLLLLRPFYLLRLALTFQIISHS